MWGVWGLRFLLRGHSRSTPVTCGSRGINASATFILFVFYFYFFSLLFLVLPGHSRSTPVTCGSGAINASATFILFVFYFSFLSLFFGFSQKGKILVMLQCEEFEG